MMVVLMPSWLLSGAVFSADKASPWMAAIMRANPVSHGVDAVRDALGGTTIAGGDLAAVLGLAAGAIGFAVWACGRRA
jgi:ABC-2 type transport system permease protein